MDTAQHILYAAPDIMGISDIAAERSLGTFLSGTGGKQGLILLMNHAHIPYKGVYIKQN